MSNHNNSRRRFLQAMGLGASGLLLPNFSLAGTGKLVTRAIPSSKERIPVIGLGSSRTFNVGSYRPGLDNVTEVMRHFFKAGGKLIDSSPMYGTSQTAIGYGLKILGKNKAVFSADKVWTWNTVQGPRQMEQSRQNWSVDKLDLIQVHNLVEWEEHIKTLMHMKSVGKTRYIGITTSHGRRHEEMLEIMNKRPLDFVQFSYNILDREAEEKLLPLAAKRGIATIINRPFQRGDLIEKLEDKPLPKWAKSIGCENWPQFLLKFIASHPHVTCVIPATSRVDHIRENMGACYGPMPDLATRIRMIKYVEKIL